MLLTFGGIGWESPNSTAMESHFCSRLGELWGVRGVGETGGHGAVGFHAGVMCV